MNTPIYSKLSLSLLVLLLSALLAADVEAQRGASRGSSGRTSGVSSGSSIGRSSGGISIGRSSGGSSIGRSSIGGSIGRSSIGSSSSLGRSSVGSSIGSSRPSSGISRPTYGSTPSRGSVTIVPSPGRTSTPTPARTTQPSYDSGSRSSGGSISYPSSPSVYSSRPSIGSTSGSSGSSGERFVGSSVYSDRGSSTSVGEGVVDLSAAARPRFRFPRSYSEVLAGRGRESQSTTGAALSRLSRYESSTTGSSAIPSSAMRSGSSSGRDIDSILQRYRGGSASASSSAGRAGTGSSALERLRAGSSRGSSIGARRVDPSRGLAGATGTSEYNRGPIGRRVASSPQAPTLDSAPARRTSEGPNTTNDGGRDSADAPGASGAGSSSGSDELTREVVRDRYEQVQSRIEQDGFVSPEDQANLGDAIADGQGTFAGANPRVSSARNGNGGGVVPGGDDGSGGGGGDVVPGGDSSGGYYDNSPSWNFYLGWNNYCSNPYGYGFTPWGFAFNAGIGVSYAFGAGSYWASPFGSFPFWYGYPYYYSCYYPLNCWYKNYYYPIYNYPIVSGYSSTTYVYDNTPSVIYIQDDSPDVIYIDAAPAGEAVAEPNVDMGAAALLPFPAAADSAGLPEGAEGFLAQGDEAFRAGRYGEAVQLYARAIEEAPEVGVLYLVLSDALFATGDYHYAAYTIRRALRLDPSLVEGEVDKHEFYEDPAEFDRQLAVLEQYVLDHNTDGDARLVLATNYLFGQRPAAAVDQLEGPFSAALQADDAGALILAAARAQQFGATSIDETSMP